MKGDMQGSGCAGMCQDDIKVQWTACVKVMDHDIYMKSKMHMCYSIKSKLGFIWVSVPSLLNTPLDRYPHLFFQP